MFKNNSKSLAILRHQVSSSQYSTRYSIENLIQTMAKRRKARELALQMLYQIDVNPDVSAQDVRVMIRDQMPEDHDLQRFAWLLFSGTQELRRQLDEKIETIADNWKLSRMAVTDRNVLRMAAYEMFHSDTPPKVVVDEAIELARTFGGENSPSFVNGILDRMIPPEASQTN